MDSAHVIVVNGDSVDNNMPPIGGADSDIAGVLTFVRAMFIGSTDYISPTEVFQVRDSMRTACGKIGLPTCDSSSFQPYP